MYLLYSHKSTNTDTETHAIAVDDECSAASACGRAATGKEEGVHALGGAGSGLIVGDEWQQVLNLLALLVHKYKY
jgi:hypothetical protein